MDVQPEAVAGPMPECLAEPSCLAVAKALDDAGKTDVLVVRGGFLEGAEIGADDVKRLAKLPPADVLRAQVVGGSPAR